MAELYTLYNGDKPVAYAYGDPWVAQALFMDDIKFKTPEEAKDWWEKNYGASSAPHYLDALKMRKEDEEKVMIQTNIFDEVEVQVAAPFAEAAYLGFDPIGSRQTIVQRFAYEGT